ncbi:EspA/EspE family type VII secretion system effector [Mycobacterium montefiorense]|uniref:ESX-1 secretion-associated protein EspA/EspE-like domain-containing protein n=1 Tax=Mycobacterium montefiorense TaxID=154654 RepID=A0AA37UR51_9MYCO|nr:EspA/EspE family type VII secretion system effector [Mycobacterium montefiorense]GBG40944.1 hypothetical protein MmonteBS_53160 [Mycobacterium montefiorense]GKU35144.1 hypothetical protein NJB14191_24900 [Mycobacterium montefiorense]GKU40055.1 hypothetical protein NJB14192_20430 [Mycobacterium montefiorense]GKU47206.1 hypothetical protein NJB14194_38240 [Mycobacterium montefiorense]GKU49449.1 hypothetical protein NJB14195_06960 [Mycobacterium montefiorense]
MFILADAARLIANLGFLGQEFVGVDSADFSSEYLAATANSMSGDGLAATATAGKMIGPRLYQWNLDRMTGGLLTGRNEARYKAASDATKSTDLILWALTIVEVFELTTGFGPPTEGDVLKEGSQYFATLGGQLTSALPDIGSWEGTASEAYADLDTSLQNLAQTMAGLDLELAAVVKDQAEWVTHMRLGFGILKNLLIAAYATEWAIKLLVPAPGNVAASQAFAITVSILAIAIATGMLTNLTVWSVLNGKKANTLADKYEEAAAATVQQGALAQAKVATTAQSTVSSFTAISDGMSGTSTVSATPAVGPPVHKAEGSVDENAQASASQTPGDDAPEAPMKTNSPLPAAPMPTLAQVSAMSGQAPQLSGRLSPHTSLANQAMGQIQQLTQTSRQGQGTTAPVEDDAAGAPPAAAGAAGAQRAPIEVAISDGQQTPAPGRAQRTT